MKMLKDVYNGARSFRLKLNSAFIIVLIIIIGSCTGKPKDYSILEFTGEDGVNNYSKSFYMVRYESDSVNPTAVLASSGDLLAYGNGNFLYYRESSQNRFSVNTKDEAEYINGKLYSINIPDKGDMIPWFEQIKNTDFSTLECLIFNSKIQESYLPYLIDIAKLKPVLGLGFSGDLEDMTGLFKIFNPLFIVGPSLYRKDFNLLSGLTSMELLVVSLKDSLYTDPLPAMPGLKQLFLTDIDKDLILNDDFLINNRQIERLIIQKSGIFDFSILKPLDNLKELTVNGFDTVVNSELIRDHKKLELLSLSGENFRYDQSLNELTNIRWISFSSDATQNEFNQFIGFHPNIEVVEIIKNEIIKKLQPLSKLRKFYGLTISDTLTDVTTVKSLRNLKYLSLPESVLKDTVQNADLQNSLPDTRIVSNQGFCLGSGWLLIIFPFIILFRIFSRERSR
jgi:hypothetical protein